MAGLYRSGTQWKYLGFYHGLKSHSLRLSYDGRNVYFRIATVPDWFLLLVCIAVPFLSALKRARRKKLTPEVHDSAREVSHQVRSDR